MPKTKKERIARILSTMESDARAGGRRLDRAVFYLNRSVTPRDHSRRAEAAGRRRTVKEERRRIAEPPHVPKWWDDEDEVTRPIPLPAGPTTRH